MQGRVHSFQSLGTLDGPGIRFVVFMQGCNLRCGCCHNPDTWAVNEGTLYTPEEIVGKAKRFRSYFGKDGGLTISGGEPLLQPSFVHEVFSLCKAEDIGTCLDTSGSLLTDACKALLEVTDRVLLDWKYPNDEDYRRYVGCSIERPRAFLEELNERGIPTTLRQVVIPTLTDHAANIETLKRLVREYPCIDKVELLPFRKICQTKYDLLGIDFPFAHLPEPDVQTMQSLNRLLEG